MAQRGVNKVGTFKIHVSNMPKDLTQNDLKLMFEPFGRIVECELFKKNYAFVHMEEEECGRAAIQELNGKLIDGKEISVHPSSNKEPPNVQTMKLTVRNVDSAVTPQHLRSLFQKFGMVFECEIRLGAAVVSLEATGDIRSAINEMNGFVLESKILEVEPVKVNLKPSLGGGGGGRPLLSFRSPKPPPPPQKRSQYGEGGLNRNFSKRGSQYGGEDYGSQYGGDNNYYQDDGTTSYYGSGEESNEPQSQYYGRPQSLMKNNTGRPQQPASLLYQNDNSDFNDQGYENFEQEHSMNGGYAEDSYGNMDQSDDYFSSPRQSAYPGFQGYAQGSARNVGPGEAYPPPPKLPRFQTPAVGNRQPSLPTSIGGERKRGERGGRYRMTTGKKAVVQAMAASGVNVPRGYIPSLMNSQSSRPRMQTASAPRAANGGPGAVQSPNYLPVAGFRGFRVPMPGEHGSQLGGSRPRAPGSMLRAQAPMLPHFRGQLPTESRPVFRAPVGGNANVRLPSIAPTIPSLTGPGATQVPPQPIMNIDFTADVDF